jgi:hypothetical protein
MQVSKGDFALIVIVVVLLTALASYGAMSWLVPAPASMSPVAVAQAVSEPINVHVDGELRVVYPPTDTPAPTMTPLPATPTVYVPPTPTPIVWPTETPAATATPKPAPTLLVDPRFAEMGVVVNQRPTARYKAIAAWCWFNGDKATAPDWAQKYMQMPEAGADHNVFGIVAGNVEPVTFRLWWPTDFTLRDTVGWINIPIFDKCWQQGSCAYNWRVDAGDELLHIGLWQGVHTSYAIVYVDIGPQ